MKRMESKDCRNYHASSWLPRHSGNSDEKHYCTKQVKEQIYEVMPSGIKAE
jgi:hypothetical protein